jgi:hypothetical protein
MKALRRDAISSAFAENPRFCAGAFLGYFIFS